MLGCIAGKHFYLEVGSSLKRLHVADPVASSSGTGLLHARHRHRVEEQVVWHGLPRSRLHCDVESQDLAGQFLRLTCSVGAGWGTLLGGQGCRHYALEGAGEQMSLLDGRLACCYRCAS